MFVFSGEFPDANGFQSETYTKKVYNLHSQIVLIKVIDINQSGRQLSKLLTSLIWQLLVSICTNPLDTFSWNTNFSRWSMVKFSIESKTDSFRCASLICNDRLTPQWPPQRDIFFFHFSKRCMVIFKLSAAHVQKFFQKAYKFTKNNLFHLMPKHSLLIQ